MFVGILTINEKGKKKRKLAAETTEEKRGNFKLGHIYFSFSSSGEDSVKNFYACVLFFKLDIFLRDFKLFNYY